jgi:hypothetical protein
LVRPAQTIKDWGAYAQLLWGIKPRVVAGLRGDWTNGDQVLLGEVPADRFRISPNITWYPTEFSKFRVQYNFDDRKAIGTGSFTVAAVRVSARRTCSAQILEKR